MPASPASLVDQAARLRDNAATLGLRAASSWAPDALLEAGRLGSVGPYSGFCAAARETADAFAELQRLRAKVADLHNVMTPLLVLADLFELQERPTQIIGERTVECEWNGVEPPEGLLTILHTLSQLPARWRQHQEQHGSRKEGDERQGTQAREGVQDQTGQEGREETGEGQGAQESREASEETRW